MDSKDPNNLDDLVYKTMPRGSYKAPSVPPPAPAVPPAPLKVSGVPLSAVIPAVKAPLTRAATPPASPKPSTPASFNIPAKPTPVPSMAPPAIPHMNELDSHLRTSFNSSSAPIHDLMPEDRPQSKLKYVVIGAIVILLVAGGAWAFVSYRNSKQAATTPTADLSGNQNASPVDNTTANPVSAIPDEWRAKYFQTATCINQDNCGDNADPDHDGLTNLQEFNLGTDPNNPDSDNDGIADGDEVNIFHYDPKNADTSGVPKYPDSAEAKAKWNGQRPYTTDELTAIAAAIKQYGLHSPTIETLGPDLVSFYTNYGAPATDNTVSANGDSGALDRDTQRSDAIKQVGFALLKYKQSNPKYPNTSSWDDMLKAINPLLAGKAVNTSDPKNVAPDIYSYVAVSGGTDFKLSYYSETQKQLITLGVKEVTALSVKDQSSIRDTQRKADLEQIASGLELYSNDHVSSGSPNAKMFPTQATWKDALLKGYLTTIPADPQTKQDYSYTASPSQDSYALQAQLESPPTGKKGYLCTADGCVYY